MVGVLGRAGRPRGRVSRSRGARTPLQRIGLLSSFEFCAGGHLHVKTGKSLVWCGLYSGTANQCCSCTPSPVTALWVGEAREGAVITALSTSHAWPWGFRLILPSLHELP